MRQPSAPAPQPVSHFAADGTFQFADGGMVPPTPAGAPAAMPTPSVAPQTPMTPARPVSPYSIRGMANGVAAGYNAARDATATGFEKLHSTFGTPVGYTPATLPSQAAPAPVAAPAPLAPAPQLGGLNLNAIQRREAAAGLKDGGMVRSRMKRGVVTHLATGGLIQGPGTGTSDSIPATMPVGSYVMPADSTSTMQQPVKVSNGETAYTPGQVHSIGLAALDAMRSITHTPVRAHRRGKANGGPVSALTSVGAPLSRDNARFVGTPTGYPNARRLANGGAVNDDQNRVRTVLAPSNGSALAAQIPGYDGPVPPATGSAPAAAPVQPAPVPAAPVTAMMGSDGVGGGAGRGYVNPPAVDPSAPAPGQGPVTSMVTGAPGVTKVTQPGAPTAYTNDPSSLPGMMQPAGTISAQNSQAADNLSAQYGAAAQTQAAQMGPSAAAANLPAGYGLTLPVDTGGYGLFDKGYQAARTRDIDRADLAELAAKTGRNGADVIAADLTGQAGIQRAGIEQGGATQRTGMEQAGATQREQEGNAAMLQREGPTRYLQNLEAAQKLKQGQQSMDAQKAYHDALASGDPKAIDSAEMALRAQTGHMPMRYEAGAGGTMGADTLHNLAVQYIGGDHSVLSGLGGGAMGAMNRGALLQAVTQEMQGRGYSPEQINAKKTDFASEMAGASTSGKRQANLDMAATEASQAFDLVRQASTNVGRTQFVPLNRALNSYRSNTGDPNVVALGAATNALMNEYARAVAGGVPTVNDKQHAEALLNSAQTPQQQEAVLNMMQREIEFARNSPQMIRQERHDRLGAGPAPGAAPTPGAPAGSAPAPQAASSSGIPNRIGSAADYAQLPSGSLYTAPDGVTRRKP